MKRRRTLHPTTKALTKKGGQRVWRVLPEVQNATALEDAQVPCAAWEFQGKKVDTVKRRMHDSWLQKHKRRTSKES